MCILNIKRTHSMGDNAGLFTSNWCTVQVVDDMMVRVDVGEVVPSQADFNGVLLATLQTVLDSEKPFTLFVNTSRVKSAPMSCSLDIVQFMKKNRPKFREFCRASAIVVKTEFVTGILKFAFKLTPPVSPNVVTTDGDAALRFVYAYMEGTAPPVIESMA